MRVRLATLVMVLAVASLATACWGGPIKYDFGINARDVKAMNQLQMTNTTLSPKNGSLLQMTVTVTNQRSDLAAFSPDDLRLETGGHAYFPVMTWQAGSTPENRVYVPAELNPGQKVEWTVLYDVPAKTTAGSISLLDGQTFAIRVP